MRHGVVGVSFRLSGAKRQARFLFCDWAAIAVSTLLALAWRTHDWGVLLQPLETLRLYTGAFGFLFVAYGLLLYLADMYEPAARFRSFSSVVKLTIAIGAAAVLLAFLFYYRPLWQISRGALAAQAAGFWVLALGWRLVFSSPDLLARGSTRVVLLGATDAARDVVELVEQRGFGEWVVVGIADDGGTPAAQAGAVPLLGSGSDLVRILERHSAHGAIVCQASGLSPESIRSLLACRARGYYVADMPTFYKRLSGKLPIEHMSDSWFVFAGGFDGRSRPVTENLLRAWDVAMAVTGLVLLAPLLVVVSVLIKCTSRGSVLFGQERLGRDERPFRLLKFRTMVANAEARTGPVWSSGGAHDPRTTVIGRFLRRTRIDELPQLWNVLVGDMSFVGPRPERPEFVELLKERIPFYSLRFAVKPGITGWAQVNFRYADDVASSAEKLRYDLFYVNERSSVLNLLILLRTLKTVLFKAGS